ncbi:MAG: hypothetical protein HQK53_02170 [Oligoflexia bacterium]|nr:hypothetical protein [Oligoflexia bacterium]
MMKLFRKHLKDFTHVENRLPPDPIDEPLDIDLQRLENIIRESLSLETNESLKLKGAHKNKLGRSGNWALLNFLQNERDRLHKINNFFLHKLRNRIKYSQTDKLLMLATKERDEIKDNLISELLSPDSVLQKNLAMIFKKSF